MHKSSLSRYGLALASALVFGYAARAQQAPEPGTPPPPPRTNLPAEAPIGQEEIVRLTPFEVSAAADTGYGAAATLAGNRLNTELRDLGNAVSVVTGQFLKDLGATNNESLLQYTLGTEVGNLQGNFAGVGDSASLNESRFFTNPNQNTRVRGLTAADNTRDYFLSDVPWESYAVDRVDLQRGPNSILFGQGSPAGIINTGMKQAGFRNANEVEARFGSYGTYRGTLDINRVLIRNQLAVRLAALYSDEKYKQEPAFNRDRRLYIATRYEPALLKSDNARTVIKADIEWGDINSNRPRMLPPIDLITPWFKSGTYQGRYSNGTPRTFNYLNRETFNAYQLQDDNTGRPNHGQERPSINGGPNAGQPNPAYQPLIGNFGQYFGGVLAFFNEPSAAPDYWNMEPRTTRGISTTGAIDGTIGGFPFNRLGAIATQAAFARAARLPYAEFGVYKNYNLTDPTVYNFYDNLLDGPNKKEWQNFRTYNLSVAQTFLQDSIGFQLDYFNEYYQNGQLSLLSDDRQAINIDFMSVRSDGTPAGKNGEPFADGTPNPNVGRPFVTDSGQFGNNSYRSNRETARATVFATHDFSQDGSRNWFYRLLGRHTVTGLYGTDRQKTDRRSWQRYAILDPAYWTFVGAPAGTKFTDNMMAVNPVIYLGPSLASRTTASGANIPRIADTFVVNTNASVRAYDSTWANPAGVNPADVWYNEYYPPTLGGYTMAQADNPSNYVGWRSVPFKITDSEAAPGNRDLLTTDARKTKSRVMSRVAVWQGHFWNNSVVGTFGMRDDVAKAWAIARSANNSPGIGTIDLGPSFALPPQYSNRIEVRSKSWSIMAHLDQLFGTEGWPVHVSIFYNRSENFQPAANRVDIYGDPIPAPNGRTVDKGILLETRDGKYSLRINRYITAAKYANSNGLGGGWFIGASQAWGGNWANIFQYDLGGATLDTQGQGNPGRYTYGAAPGETADQAAARENADVAAWRAWQKSVDPRFYRAWGIDFDPTKDPITQVHNLNSNTPNGFALTEDSLSKGYEYELNAQPVKNLRLTINASETHATRKNIGGAALADFVSKYEKALKTTAAGDLRIWWGGAGNETTLYQWNNNVGAEWAVRHLQESTDVPELRVWHINGIANYDFTEGFLRGVNVGVGYRWLGKVVIGYPPMQGATANDITFDLAHPYRGPAEENIDGWIGYGRRNVFKGINWRIQLNVRNIGKGDELIPITTQPDGTPAGWRIAPTQVWTVSNTFTF